MTGSPQSSPTSAPISMNGPSTAAEIRALLGPVFETQVAKIIDHIDPHCQAWIERCPFIVISSIDATGAMDVSPKGDPAGFVKRMNELLVSLSLAGR